MANSINLEELRAQRAVCSVKASEQAVDNFIETGEVQAQEVIDPRQQSFFKESQKPRETSAICGEDLNIEIAPISPPQENPIQRELIWNGILKKRLSRKLKRKKTSIKKI